MGLLELAILAFVISLVAGGLGFSGIARGAASIAKIAFGIFLVVAIILLIMFALGIQLFT
ncbi:MAG TPA: DUF1328 domain-containing protein [Pyrinomonadaceae bacterium]